MNDAIKSLITEAQERMAAKQQLDCVGAMRSCASGLDGSAKDIDHHLSNRWVTENAKCSTKKFRGLDLLRTDLQNDCPASDADIKDGCSRYEKVLIDSKGKPMIIPLRKGNKHAAFIDQMSFSFHQDTLMFESGMKMFDEIQYLVEFSIILEYIFGFGISEKLPHSGGRFYKSCFKMGTDNILYGRVHIGSDTGSQSETVLVELTATGCQAAKDDWEIRLFEFLAYAYRPKITRVDLAVDFFNGEYSPEQAYDDWLDGLYTCHHLRPDGDRHGSDWDSDNGKGKTFYVGTRSSGKFARIYNKSAELGHRGDLNWTRFEVEFKAKGGYVIPLDAIVNAGKYFAGAYPICEKFQDYQIKRIDTSLKKFEYSWEHMLKFAKQQIGRVVNAIKFYQPDLNDSDVLNLLTPDHNKLPKRLDIAAFDALACIVPLKSDYQRSIALDRYISCIFPDSSFNPDDDFAHHPPPELVQYL